MVMASIMVMPAQVEGFPETPSTRTLSNSVNRATASLHANDQILANDIAKEATLNASRYQEMNRRLDDIEEGMKALEQLLREFIDKE